MPDLDLVPSLQSFCHSVAMTLLSPHKKLAQMRAHVLELLSRPTDHNCQEVGWESVQCVDYRNMAIQIKW